MSEPEVTKQLRSWKFVGFDPNTAARREGVVIAADVQGAVSAGMRQGLMAVSAYEHEATLWSQIKDAFKGTSGSSAERLAFLRSVARINTAVKSQKQVLNIAARQVKPTSPLRPAVDSLIEATTNAGATLDEAFARQENIWGEDVAAIVAAGLKSGGLNEALRTLAKHKQRTARTQRKIRRSLSQQGILALVAIGVTWLLLASSIPAAVEQAQSFDADIPALTEYTMAFGSFFTAWGPAAALLLLVLVFAVYFAGQSEQYGQAVASFWLNFPGIGKIIRSQSLALASGVIAIGLTAGARSRDVVKWAGDAMPNRGFKHALHDIAAKMHEGSTFGDAADEHVPLLPHEFAALAHQSQLGLEDNGEHWREYADEISEYNQEFVDGFAERLGLYSILIVSLVLTVLALAWSAPTLSLTEQLITNPGG